MKVKYVKKKHYDALNLGNFPNIQASGSVSGMKARWGPCALLVQCGNYIYNVSGKPGIYFENIEKGAKGKDHEQSQISDKYN